MAAALAACVAGSDAGYGQIMEGDELDSVDLTLGPAQPASVDDFSVKIDGEVVAQDHPIRRRVADVLARQRKEPFATAARKTSISEKAAPDADRTELAVLGQSLGPDYQRILEDVIRPEIDDELANGGLGGVGPAGVHGPPGCVCVDVGLGGDRIGGWFATPPWFTAAGAWVPPPAATGRDFWLVGIMFDHAPFNTGVISLRNGATANPPFGKDETLIGLTNATTFSKQIWATNLCSGRVKSVFQRTTNPIAHQMPLIQLSCRQGIDTLEFSKVGFLSQWHDVGHIPPAEFWKHFGGTHAIFDWQVD